MPEKMENSMINRTALAAAIACLLVAAPAFADEDAGSTDASSGVTPTADAGTTADAGAVDDAGSSTPTADAGSTADAGGTDDATTSVDGVTSPDADDSPDGGMSGGGFTENACWDEKCPKEVDACKTDKVCNALATCIKGGKTLNTCAGDQQKAGATQEQLQAASATYNAIQECGWKACADPTKGTCVDKCGQYLGAAAPCNCDGFCVQYGDCCQDHKGVCSAMYSCGGGKCGQARGQDNAADTTCSCDDGCKAGDSCCGDYEVQCGGTKCEPSCTGKECGPDGCGGSCAPGCSGGAACDAQGKCIGGGSSSGADAGESDDAGASSGGASSGGTSSGGVADASDVGTGSSGGTTTTPPADSGGCSATPTSDNSQLALILFALAALALIRRRSMA